MSCNETTDDSEHGFQTVAQSSVQDVQGLLSQCEEAGIRAKIGACSQKS